MNEKSYIKERLLLLLLSRLVMEQVNSGMAYLLWCLCFFGFCGVQRIYTGHIVLGLLYFCTFGLCFIGQLIDLFLIPSMVDERNVYLRGVRGATPTVNQSITLNLGEISELQQLQPKQLQTTSSVSPMQKLLKAAKEHGGQLSIAQAAMYTELPPEEIKGLLQEAMKAGYAEIGNDPYTGAIRYHFDV